METTPSYVALPYVSPKTADDFQRRRNILISEPITKDLAVRVMMLIKTMESESEDEPIWIIIDSAGGEVQAGWTIYDAMNLSRCPIYTVCFGEAASIAAVIFANGDKGHRYMLEHSKLMIHQPWAIVGGFAVKESELAYASEDLSKTRAEIEEALRKASGLSIEDVHACCNRDYRMSADEAISMGFADRILS
jgi:ATP-dependent Clp protease protease subunit